MNMYALEPPIYTTSSAAAVVKLSDVDNVFEIKKLPGTDSIKYTMYHEGFSKPT